MFACSSLLARLAAVCLAGTAASAALAADFSVTPIRAQLAPGALTETITVTNDSPKPLRVSIKLSRWTQDGSGADVYEESTELVYFPRQMVIEPGARRLVRVGARAPAGGAERTYRLFIEEVPEPTDGGSPAVRFYLRFGVPVFVPPPAAVARPEVSEATLEKGRLAVRVNNSGNQHFRLTRVVFSDGAGFSREVAGWYSLAGSTRAYATEIPPEVCRQARTLLVRLEGEGLAFDRKIDVDPAKCS